MNFLIGFALALAVALGAQAAPPPSASDVFAVATFSTPGTFEVKVAPAITRLALQRHNAATALRKGRISASTAKTLQATADQARAHLEAAWKHKQPTPEARHQLAAAAVLQNRIDTLLHPEGHP